MTDSPTSQAMHLAMTELKEREARIAELETALRRTTDMLGSACLSVSQDNGLMRMLAAIDAARSVLNKETNRG
jgi:hypothetical protein